MSLGPPAVISDQQLRVLIRRAKALRSLCRDRAVSILGIHLFDPAAEARVLASRLGSPWPHLASDPDLPEELLAVNGEKANDLLADLATYLQNR